MKLVSADMIAWCNILVLFWLALEGKCGVVVPVLGCIRGFGSSSFESQLYCE